MRKRLIPLAMTLCCVLLLLIPVSAASEQALYQITMEDCSEDRITVSVLAPNDERNVRLILAAYNDFGKMLACQTASPPRRPGGEAELSVFRSEDTAAVKVFVLDAETFVPVQRAWSETNLKPAADTIQLSVNGRPVFVRWEDNPSADALRELVRDKPLAIPMSGYGGFEQVGSLGTSLPRNDAQTTTSPGDIVLYSGSNLVLFYGSNSWAYTRLGKIEGMSAQELTELLGSGDVTVTLSLA